MLTIHRKIECTWRDVDGRFPALGQVNVLLFLQAPNGTTVARTEDNGPFTDPDWKPQGRTQQQLNTLMSIHEVAKNSTSQTTSQRTAHSEGLVSAGARDAEELSDGTKDDERNKQQTEASSNLPMREDQACRLGQPTHPAERRGNSYHAQLHVDQVLQAGQRL